MLLGTASFANAQEEPAAAPVEEEALIADEVSDADVLVADESLTASENLAADEIVVPFGEEESVDEDGPVEDDVELSLPDPVYTIESIEILGNRSITRERILTTMGIQEGDEILLSDLETAKVRLNAKGAVQAVDMSLAPGSEKGKIRIELRVEDRMSFQVNDYYIGVSKKSEFWGGMNVSWLNLFGTGHRLNTAFVASMDSEYAWRVNYVIPKIAGSIFSLSMGFHLLEYKEDMAPRYAQLSEVEREDVPNWYPLDQLELRRHSFSVVASAHFLDHLSLFVGVQPEFMSRDDSRLSDIARLSAHDFVKAGSSVNTVMQASLVFDTRRSFRMALNGHSVGLNLSGTFKTAASDYEYIRAVLFHQSNFSLGAEHVLRLGTFAGLIAGDAPYYEKFRFGDFYSFVSSRVLGFNPTNTRSLDIFKTGADTLGYEDYLVSLNLEYAWQHVLNVANINKLEVYGRVGATYADSFKLTNYEIGLSQDRANNDVERKAFPCDGSVDLGVRLQTEFGFFNVSLSYVLNLIPW